MAGSRPRIHHHLPQSYQAGFCRGGRIFVYDRTTGRLRRDKPKNVAAIAEDYTILTTPGIGGTRIERFFAEVDGVGAELIGKLRDRKPLSPDERESFSWYVSLLAVRVPRFARWMSERETAISKLYDREHLNSPAQIQDLIDRSDLSAAVRADTNAKLIFEFLKTEEYVKTPGHDYRIRLLIESGLELQPRLHDMHWVVAHAEEGGEFVTSDNPVVDSERFVSVPLAFDAALMMVPTQDDTVRIAYKVMQADLVHGTNVAVAQASERLVLGRDEKVVGRVVADAKIEDRAPDALFDLNRSSD
jgi:hypothetical protein